MDTLKKGFSFNLPLFGGKINWFGPKNTVKRRALNLENQKSSQGPRCCQTQGFNLLQINPNWFVGIGP
jgi:hypothetical protein